MTRLRDWQSRLAELIAQRMHAEFEFGAVDCCTFAADAVQAITGVDPAADLRGYATELQALRLLGKHGGLAALAAARCGPECEPAQARVGDVVLGRLEREMLGVCTGETWHAPGADGLVAVPMWLALRAWRV